MDLLSIIPLLLESSCTGKPDVHVCVFANPSACMWDLQSQDFYQKK